MRRRHVQAEDSKALPAPTIESPNYDNRGAANFLRISERSLDTLVARGEIRVKYYGRKRLFRPEWLLAWMRGEPPA